MNALLKLISVIIPFFRLIGDNWKGVSITGTVDPPINLIGQNVTFSCQVRGCTSTNLQVHLYKWEGSINQTLHVYNSTKQHSAQESHTEERKKNGSLTEHATLIRTGYMNGFLSVTLLHMQQSNSGQYVCALTCEHIYKEAVMEVIVEDVSVNGTVNPDIGLIGQHVILSCQINGCTSSSLQVHVYKWEGSKNQTLYINSSSNNNNNVKQHRVQGNETEKKGFNDTLTEHGIAIHAQYKDGLLLLTLLHVQLSYSGWYVCAVKCDHVYNETIMEVIIQDVSVTGTVNPDIGLIGQHVILSCQVNGCTSPSLQIHLYKWEGSKNQTLYISNNNIKQHRGQESNTEERIKVGPHTEHGTAIHAQYKDGLLLVTLLHVQLSNCGQYVCAVNCDHVYNETIMEVIIQESHLQTFENWMLSYWIVVTLLPIFLVMVVMYCLKKKGEQKEELPKLNNENNKQNEVKEELCKLHIEFGQLEAAKEFSDVRVYRAVVVMDPKTAHPRLEVSQDGTSVWDTGNVSKVSNSEESFDSHTCVLATCGFSKGKRYWEVEVGQKKKWDVGVAGESAPRKGNITLSPQNGYWIIGLDGWKDYWARTDPWTRLKVSGKPRRIGIFLNVTSRVLIFYDVDSKSKLHTFRISHPGKLYPFFSTGALTTELDSQPLKVKPWFEEEEIVDER